jgi:hypothetical protein
MGGMQSSLRIVDDQHEQSCVHHWLLAEPHQNQISGSCKHCGATRIFPGTPEGAERFDDYREITQSSTYYADQRRSA